MNVTKNLLDEFKSKFESKSNNKMIQNSIIKNGIKNTVFDHQTFIKHDHVFDIETTLGDITSQKNSGRCWIFASLNMARVKAAKNLNVSSFEFSQNYFAFYDKIEKANTFLNYAIQTANLPLENREVYHLINKNVASDGGYWEYFANLLKKYGAVPKSIMPETFHSGNTTDMNEQIDKHLKNGMKKIRALVAQGADKTQIQVVKEDALYRVYDIVSKCLGTPVTEFTYEYKDKDNKYHKIENITPVEFFAKYVGKDFDKKVNLVHDPRNLYHYGTKYVLKYQKSVYEDQDVEMINVPLDVIKSAVIASLKDNLPVWFACDVDPFKDNKSGIFDPKLYDFDSVFEPISDFNKEDRIIYFNSMLNHAMAFVGVKTENGKPIAWKVENSWGDDSGKKGVYSMSDEWFDEYNFSVIVDPKYVPEEYLKADKSVVLELWEPFA
ncbi:C1 family peptidase [Mycoplasma sp. 1232]|uniref:C1 family peptidase n=1 Tax=Mycoplasma sp. 1232 TaxID=3108527 RepID=UPI002B26001E|nr:C1 family peptidase [Mycoplasma sp. 1232]MEA4333729.1 C1 family peptidase [Mycoplasma sp. 1232]